MANLKISLLQIEASPSQCHCTVGHLENLYEAGLGRPVEVEPMETCPRGGDTCTIKISW